MKSSMKTSDHVRPLRVLICDPELASSHKLRDALEGMREEFIESVVCTHSFDESSSILDKVIIDAIYIDPYELGLDQAAEYIFNIRKEVPHIVFVLYSNFEKLIDLEEEFYKGKRIRFRHYFRLNKELDTNNFRNEVIYSVYQCRSDIRVESSFSRILDQRNFLRSSIPVEIEESYSVFKKNWERDQKIAFIMMQFGSGKVHKKIESAINEALKPFDIIGVRADSKEFHSQLYYNVLTYIYGCTFGIAVFERIEEDSFNPNVSLEVGYMLALRKPICFLKDKTLKTLQTDLVGRLYNPFDPHVLDESIKESLSKWIADKAFE